MEQKPKLMEQLRETIRLRQFSYRTEQAYLSWVKRYNLFHKKRHPAEMDERGGLKVISGAGLRVQECVRLRVLDIDFSYRKGHDLYPRFTASADCPPLPTSLSEA